MGFWSFGSNLGRSVQFSGYVMKFGEIGFFLSFG